MQRLKHMAKGLEAGSTWETSWQAAHNGFCPQPQALVNIFKSYQFVCFVHFIGYGCGVLVWGVGWVGVRRGGGTLTLVGWRWDPTASLTIGTSRSPSPPLLIINIFNLPRSGQFWVKDQLCCWASTNVAVQVLQCNCFILQYNYGAKMFRWVAWVQLIL